ncbi:hypothetical protein RCO28_20525 [Streptomyces sp. LHD-70]|uniref:hypothetical protein n=1 Tax=Streptomyces sp. LHD-70 TaxID=3072140 RepID=UPI00280E10D1|nr:hypothetical protein [Streptomyces sp. LHD-70]MDQ8704860.1 hypothetical protein [Streptomyces sp. LHD-70]
MSPDDDHGRPDDGGYGGSGHTRTRLPDGDGGYGTARRMPRSPRSLVTVVSVVVLLVAAIAFANRGGGEGSSDSAPSEDGRGPAAAPTAPSGQKPVSSGFGRDREGVQSAAANYAAALGSDGMFNAGRRHAIVKAVAHPGAEKRLQSGFNADYSKDLLGKIGLNEDGSAPRDSTFVNRTMPAGTKVKAYSDSEATVEVWCNGLFGLTGEDTTNPVTSSWFTVTLKLKWNGDWKVLETRQKTGPTPVTGDNPVSGADEIADAVKQFGGFTYAR